MNVRNKIKQFYTNIALLIRNIFIKEKKKYISSKTFDNINFNFKNLQLYSEIGIYKMIFLLVFIIIFLVIVVFYAYIDLKSNIDKNKELVKIEPLKLVIKNPINTDLPQDYKSITYSIRRGDTLLNILTNIVKIEYDEAYECINKLKSVYNINNLKIGQKLFIKYKDTAKRNNDSIERSIKFEELKIIDDNLLEEITVLKNNDNIFVVNKEKVSLTQTYNKYIVNINNGVYTDGVNAGIPADIVLHIMNYYSFDIDFQRDIKKGDWLEVVFEAFYTENGKKVRNGNIVYANLHTNSRDNKIYRFTDDKNMTSYFNENGISAQKSLLRTPINGARISSGYTARRKHPVLGYTAAHKGIDFAAPTGTPFYAAGNGIVKKIITGCKDGDRRCGGGFGNYIAIKHNNTYTTEYGHISRIASNIKVGSKVTQGQIIAYVGNTGLSTGPHLHYGVIFNNERINPTRIKSVPLKRLDGKNLLDFINTRDKINSLRNIAINQSMLESNND